MIPRLTQDIYGERSRTKKGFLIVIEGADGAGKTTQAQLLLDSLKKRSQSVKYVDFPQYYNSFHGKIIARYLRGELGTIDQVSPYFVSLAFAVDRASAKKGMESFLRKGGYIISNRYATSSMVYQAAKFKNEKEQEEFLDWNYDLEYKVNKIPQENIVLYLHVPWQIGMQLTQKKASRPYLNGKSEDIHEMNPDYRKAVEEMYLRLVKKYDRWVKIDCVENNQILSPQAIHEKILAILKDKKILK